MNFLKRFRTEIFLVVGIIAIITVLSAIFLLRNTTHEPVAQPPPSALTPSPHPQPLDMAEWQTYRNDEFGFEVKIHPNFLAPGLSDEFKVEIIRVGEMPEDSKKFFEMLESSIPGEELIGINPEIGTIVKRENVKLDSCIATQYLIKNGVVEVYGTYCTYGENQLRFSLTFKEEVSSLEKEKAIEFYDQTLATFRFVEG